MSTTAQNYEQLSYGSKASQWRGRHRAIIGDAVATRKLTAQEAGTTCLFDRAAGVVYTLPAPVAGMKFTFQTTVDATSNAYQVSTNAASVFLLGAVEIGTIATASGASFSADGTAIVGLSSVSGETGWLIGSKFTVVAINSTQWAIWGFLIGSGTITTPFI